VDINGNPFIYHQLKLLKKNGISKVLICAGHYGDQLEAYLKDGKEFGVLIEYSFDGEKLLGTAGAIRNAWQKIDDEFMLINGDSYLDIDYPAVYAAFKESGKMSLMTVIKNNNEWDKSNVEFSNGMVKRYDKKVQSRDMIYIDYGLIIMKRACFVETHCNASLHDGNYPIDMSVIYQDLISKGEMAGYEVKKRFYEIGSFKGLEETRALLK